MHAMQWLLALLIARGSRGLKALERPLVNDEVARRQRIRDLYDTRRLVTEELEALGEMTPRLMITQLYEAFNERDAESVSALLSDDVLHAPRRPSCVSILSAKWRRYEDLLLGDTTICRGKEAFRKALQWHPAFAFSLGRLDVVVDRVACDGERSVGVEWHVEWNGLPIPLGRGLSLATLDDQRKLDRVVDICEAPWRTVGLFVRPFLSAFGATSAVFATLSLAQAAFFIPPI